jgi:hypothetical protein
LGDEVRLQHSISLIPIALHEDEVSKHGEIRCPGSSCRRARSIGEKWAVERDP